MALSNPPKKPEKNEHSVPTSHAPPVSSTDRKTALSLVPRGVKTASSRTTNGVNAGPKKPMNNDEFRNLLGK